MNKILLTLSLLLTTTLIFAQTPDGLKLRVGVRTSLPLNDFGTLYTVGLGGEVQAEYGINDSFSAIFSTGYNSFLGKNLDFGLGSVKLPAFGYIPALAGVRYYASDRIFVGGQVGYGLYMAEGENEGGLNYQPQLGINLERFQFALNYNATTVNGETLSHLGLTAVFKIGE